MEPRGRSRRYHNLRSAVGCHQFPAIGALPYAWCSRCSCLAAPWDPAPSLEELRYVLTFIERGPMPRPRTMVEVSLVIGRSDDLPEHAAKTLHDATTPCSTCAQAGAAVQRGVVASCHAFSLRWHRRFRHTVPRAPPAPCDRTARATTPRLR